MNYYYLAASLPMLSLETPPPFSFDKFRKLCQEHLACADLSALDELAGPVTDRSENRFVAQWRDKEIELRNALVKIRVSRLRRDASLYLKEQKGFDTYIDKAASDAFSKSNPMERELALDRFRWRQIEELAGYDPFSGRAILAYGLKLRLAERWAAMDEEKGRKKAQGIGTHEMVDGMSHVVA